MLENRARRRCCWASWSWSRRRHPAHAGALRDVWGPLADARGLPGQVPRDARAVARRYARAARARGGRRWGQADALRVAGTAMRPAPENPTRMRRFRARPVTSDVPWLVGGLSVRPPSAGAVCKALGMPAGRIARGRRAARSARARSERIDRRQYRSPRSVRGGASCHRASSPLRRRRRSSHRRRTCCSPLYSETRHSQSAQRAERLVLPQTQCASLVYMS